MDNKYDYDTPIEEMPGYVGCTFEDWIDFAEGLKPLSGFDFALYGEIADDLNALERKIEVNFGDGPRSLTFSAYMIHEIVEAIPCISAIYDCPPDQGPAGGSGHVFVLDEPATIEEASACATALRAALDEDFAAMKVGLR